MAEGGALYFIKDTVVARATRYEYGVATMVSFLLSAPVYKLAPDNLLPLRSVVSPCFDSHVEGKKTNPYVGSPF